MDSQSNDGSGTPPSGNSDSGQTVVGEKSDGLAARSSLTDLSQIQPESSFNNLSKVVIDPQRVAAFTVEDFLKDNPWDSPSDQRLSATDEREKHMIEQQKQELDQNQREYEARMSLLALSHDTQSGSAARSAGLSEEQFHAQNVNSQLVDSGTRPVSGINTVLTTTTALAWMRPTSTNPRVTQSQAQCTATSIQSSDGPNIPSLSELLLQCQLKLEEDLYAMLHYIMVNRLTNIDEAIAQHDVLKKFYFTLKGYVQQLDSRDKNLQLVVQYNKKIKLLHKSIFQHTEEKKRQLDNLKATARQSDA